MQVLLHVTMHWTIRLGIALVATVGWLVGLYAPVVGSLPPWSWHGQITIRLIGIAGELFGHPWGSSAAPRWQYDAATAVIHHIPTVLITFAVYGVLSLVFHSKRAVPDETCCRQCGYILRGLKEARCPECGEQV